MKRPFAILAHLVTDMRSAAILIDGFPDDQEFTMNDMATLDDVRHAALRLAEAAQVAIDEVDGRR